MRSLLRWFKSSCFTLTLSMACFLAPAQVAQAVTIYVNNAIATGGNGSTWNTAFKYLQDALAYAGIATNNVTEIWVAKSLLTPPTPYRPDQTNASPAGSNVRSETFSLVSGVKVIGGAIAGEATLVNREKDGKNTILTGEIGNSSLLTDNSYHVVTTTGTTNPPMTPFNTFLDGFTVTSGYGQITGTSSSNGGAGIFCQNDGNARFVNCLITNNFAGVSLAQLTEEDVEALAPSSPHGAGVQANTCSPVFVGCTIKGNQPITNWYMYGGGFAAVNGGTPELIACTLQGNKATRGGGVAAKYGSGIIMTNCLIIQNTLVNTLNAGPFYYGGGVGTDRSSAAIFIKNCTFALNNAITDGGGYAQWDNSNSVSRVVYNCIFWQNTKATSTNNQIFLNTSGNALEVKWSDVQGGQAGITGGGSLTYADNQDVDPQFVDPDGFDNISGTLDDNFRLPYNSLCIDDGDKTLCPPDDYDINSNGNFTEETPDRDRLLRVRQNNVEQGAYESHQFNGCCGDANSNNVVDIDDLVLVITGWGNPSLGDVATSSNSCVSNGFTNMDDLVAVITHWGNCPNFTGPPVDGIPTSFQDCWNKCSASFEAGSSEWHECMDACILLLCRLGYTQYCP